MSQNVTEEEAIPPDRAAEAEGKLGQAVGGDIEALQGRKVEPPIGQAGNGDRRPERKGVASTSRDLSNDPRPKSQ
jgi:hypothetical protein